MALAPTLSVIELAVMPKELTALALAPPARSLFDDKLQPPVLLMESPFELEHVDVCVIVAENAVAASRRRKTVVLIGLKYVIERQAKVGTGST
jgi:hypothetical protein